MCPKILIKKADEMHYFSNLFDKVLYIIETVHLIGFHYKNIS